MNRLTALFICIFLSVGLLAQEANRHTMKYQGYEREYYFYMPEILDAARPLIFMLHGHSGHAKGYYTEFLNEALNRGYAVCYPQALVEPTPKKKTGWNVGYPFREGWNVDDAAFLCALRKKLLREYKLNPRNVFFSGMSNGGDMTYYMANIHSKDYAAFAALAGTEMEWIYRELRPSCPVAFMAVHGTNDNLTMYDGDPQNKGGWGKYVAVPAAIGRMVSNNCCTHEICDTLPVVRNTVIRHRYVGGTDDKDVVLYQIINGPHKRGDDDMPLVDTILAFFKRYMK